MALDSLVILLLLIDDLHRLGTGKFLEELHLVGNCLLSCFCIGCDLSLTFELDWIDL